MHADLTLLHRYLATAPALPADVRAWTTGILFASLPGRQRARERNRFLLAASALLPDAPPWVKAGHLHAEVEALRRALPAEPDTLTVRGLCACALLVMPGRSLSQRGIYRVLTRRP